MRTCKFKRDVTTVARTERF